LLLNSFRLEHFFAFGLILLQTCNLKRFLKMALYLSLGAVVLIGLGAVLFIWLNPAFGSNPSKAAQAAFSETGHYEDGEFQNQIKTSMDMGFAGFMKTLWEFSVGGEGRKPPQSIPMVVRDSEAVEDYNGQARLLWFGHSAFLLQTHGLNILIDPMLGDVPAPHPWLGSNRYNPQLPLSIDAMPEIDLVIISHDHYDHLDYGSMLKLREKTKHFYVPLGVGAHLEKWEFPETQYTEMDWWDARNFDELELIFTPARHFSGRGLTNRNSTLWGSWVILGNDFRLYFSGDSGYGPHFSEIGERYGPFDLGLMECGQYNERWKVIHMLPGQTAQAGIDVRAETIMPIHWGAFTLALHDWNDPVKQLMPEAQNLGLPVVIPKIGEFIEVKNPGRSPEEWWLTLGARD
jgi:L-ascorbate metabolism protein UlaG (beta-lactamase superfamily)